MNEAEILALLGKQDKRTESHIYVQAAKLITKADHYFKPLKGLVVPEFSYDLKGRTAGEAIARYKAQEFRIRLNNDALLDSTMREHMLAQTLPHEVAHSVVQQLWPTEPGHGYKWAQVMHLFGVPPLRTHNLPLKKARKTRRFIHVCYGCGQNWNMGLNAHRKLQANPNYYICKICRSHFNPNGSEVKIK